MVVFLLAVATVAIGTALWLLPTSTDDISRVSLGLDDATLKLTEVEPIPAAAAEPLALQGQVTEPGESATASSSARVLPPNAALGSMAVHAHWHDGRPAVDVVVKLHDGAGFRSVPEGRTDEDGLVSFERILAGTVFARSDRGGGVKGEVSAGAETVLDLVIPAGRRVLGLVVDEDDSPVPDAAIWLSDNWNTIDGAVVTRSADDGVFMIESVSDDRHVGASKDPFAPSYLHDLQSDEDWSVPVVLVLRRPSGRIAGMIVDENNEPIAGVTVMIGEYAPWAGPPAGPGAGPPPVTLTCEVNGSFTTPSLPTGRVDVVARAPGFTPAKRSVDVAAGSVTELTFVLQAEGRVEGVARDGDGRPVAGAMISFGPYGNPKHSSALTLDDGSYALPGLPPGELELTAAHTAFFPDVTQLVVARGETARWDPVLQSGLSITGVVIDRNSSAPLSGWWVMADAASSASGFGHGALTDAKGRFRIEALKNGTYSLLAFVMDGGASSWMPSARRDGVVPGEGEVTIEADSFPLGGVQGIIVGPQGQAASGWVKLKSVATGRDSPIFRLATDGGFRCDRLPVGLYALQVVAKGLSNPEFQELTILPGEQTDLGVLTLLAGGTLRALLTSEGSADVSALMLTLSDGDQRWSQMQIMDQTALSEPLAAGSWILTVEGRGIAAQLLDVTISEAGESIIDVALRSGVELPIRLEWSDDAQDQALFELTVTDDSGTVAHRSWHRRDQSGSLSKHVFLGSGDYSVVVREGGVSREREVHVARGPLDPLVFTMN